jgi:Xaa-Pro aminopeptidase
MFSGKHTWFALDIYARRWLWDAGKDYGHGTGVMVWVRH